MPTTSRASRTTPTPRQLGAAVRGAAADLSGDEADLLAEVLWEDVTSEYDARFLAAELAPRRAGWSPAMRRAQAAWERDELSHHLGFRAAYEAAFPGRREVDADLAARRPDFTRLAPLLEDELRLAALCAYDEFATVRVFRHYLPLYARLGPELVAFVRSAIADEARHYASFLAVLRDEHAERLKELPAILAEIRACEGQPYAATFLLDHDDPVFGPALLASAEQALLRHARRPGLPRPALRG